MGAPVLRGGLPSDAAVLLLRPENPAEIALVDPKEPCDVRGTAALIFMDLEEDPRLCGGVRGSEVLISEQVHVRQVIAVKAADFFCDG